MSLSLKLKYDEPVSLNGEMIIRVKKVRGGLQITFEGPKDKYEIKTLRQIKLQAKQR